VVRVHRGPPSIQEPTIDSSITRTKRHFSVSGGGDAVRLALSKSQNVARPSKDVYVSYVKSDEMLGLLTAAATGDGKAIERLGEIDVPFAASPDWSETVLVQMKSATVDAAGRVRVQNTPPDNGGRPQQGLDVYTRNAIGAACASVSLPSAFRVRAVVYRSGKFVFESEDGRSVRGTLAQILQGMRPVQFVPEGVTEQQLESSFLSIPEQVPPQPEPRRTAAQNPPITDEKIGTFTFDERLQSFYTEDPGGTRLASLRIETADRVRANTLIDVARRLLHNLDTIDRNCKQLAADRLLDLKNRGWREPGEEIISEGRFTASIRLESVSIDSQGGATAYYHDGGLFGGHTIVIELGTDHVPTDAVLAG
jgi:hypothetical protein